MAEPPLRLLLADDDPVLLHAMTDLLTHRDDVTLVAAVADGARALDVLATRIVDVALLDADMPVLDGVSTTVRVRAEHPDVTVVIFTAFEHDDFLPRAMAAGAAGFLTKDTPVDELIPLLRRAHAGEAVLSPRPTSVVVDSYRTRAQLLEDESGFRDAVAQLPDHLREVLDELALATPTSVIATHLNLSEASVRTYTRRILELTGCSTRTELVLHAARGLPGSR